MKYIYMILVIIFAILLSMNIYIDIFNIVIFSVLIIIIFISIIYKEKIIINKKNIIFSFIFSIILSILVIPSFIYRSNINYITIKNISNKPIVIEGIYKDEKLVKTNYKYIEKYDLINNANLKTEYREYNKLDSKYKLTLYKDEVYKINVDKVKNIEIDFQRKEKNYNILINNKKITIDKYIYSSNRKANMIYDSSYKYKFDNKIVNTNIIKNIGISIFVLFIMFGISIYSINNKKNILKLLFITIIELNPIINIDIFTKITLVILLLLFLKLDFKLKKIDKKNNIFYIITSLLISFCFMGDRLINDNINLLLILVYIVFNLFIYLLLPYIISYFDYIKVKKNNNSKIIIHRVILFFIIIGICFLYHYIYYPFIVHVDGYMILDDINNNIFSNWHPYFHCLLVSLFKSVLGDVKFFLYFRFIIYSLMLNSILFYFNKKGMKLRNVYLISILLTLCPTTGIMLVTFVKDIDFSIWILLLTFYLYLLINDNSYFNSNKLNYIYLFISLLFVTLFRHNGLYIFIVMVLVLIIIFYKKRDILVLFICLISTLFIYIVNNPLYNYLAVDDGPRNVNISTMLHGLNYLVVNNQKINKGTYKYLTKNVLPKNKIITCYDKYNIDLLLHYTEYNIRDMDINTGKIIKGYLLEFVRHPIYLIKDRLYGTDLVWNVGEKDRVRVYKYQTVYDEFDNNYAEILNIKYEFNSFYKVVNKILLYITSIDILNALLFRGGIYFCILLLILLYSILKRKNIIYILPSIINILTLFIAMGHQEYRYVWFMQLVVLFIILVIRYDDIKIKLKK